MDKRVDVSSREKIAAIVEGFLARRSLARKVAPDDNLRDVGLTSLDMVNVVLSVESEFSVVIPEKEITPANFRTVAAIDSLIATLR
jgi:acyl carrier protein